MTDDEPSFEQMNEKLYQLKSKPILEKGGAHAVNSKFRAIDQKAFEEALKAKPNMTWLEFLALLKPK